MTERDLQLTGDPDLRKTDPLEKSHIGSDLAGGVWPAAGNDQILTGGMSCDADNVGAPELDGPACESYVGNGSIDDGGGIDDAGTRGGGTAALPGDLEVAEERRGRLGRE